MVEGHVTENDGKQWDLTLRDGLAFHDGTPVLARDCVATIQRFAKRYPFGEALMARTDELTAASDKVIRFRLKKPFPLLPNALAEVYCAIMPERLAKTDAMSRSPRRSAAGRSSSWPPSASPASALFSRRTPITFRARTASRASMPARKSVYIDRVVWNFIPDPATASAALAAGRDRLVGEPDHRPGAADQEQQGLTLTVKDRTGEIGCLRFNHLLPPFDNAAIRRVVVAAMDQKEIMEAVAGAEPSLIKTDVGMFVPGTPMASTVGVEITRGPKDYDKLKQDLIAAGYKGEKVVILAASTIPTIWAEAQVATDVLKKIGMNIDFQALEWGTVVQRRASQEPIDKGGWNIFYTYLGGFGNISPAPNIAIRGSGANGSWFGWPTDPKMEALREAWFDAPDIAAQQKICEQMQVEFWQNPPYAPLGMYDQPTAFHSYLKDVRDGWPQFYGVKKNV